MIAQADTSTQPAASTQAPTVRLAAPSTAAIRPRPSGATAICSAAYVPNTRLRRASGTCSVNTTVETGAIRPPPTPAIAMPIATGQNPARVAMNSPDAAYSTFAVTQAAQRRPLNNQP